ncbi:hypothetical protein FH972_022727 [Carpinus fangiana]|uniref:GST C-terminal domain-containing protein n=1 Tax=Carpinus fangiana TaxID=176857 RepID=A0A5N6KT30_9ROSI|nr:hypothetical protein FH972_022727 [Carpinus fangiana]
MSGPAAKKQRTQPQYELLYHPGIPGRGEYIRLAFEAAGVSYSDVANEKDTGYDEVKAAMDPKATNIEGGNPVIFAPPALRVPGAGKDGSSPLLIFQTPNILSYLGPKIGMTPDNEADALHVNALALTALDLNNETHDTHHPVAPIKYYEEQKNEALAKATDFRESRIPKYFSFFERVLKGNEATGQGKYLVGDKISYADTTLWQVVDGLKFAFPKEMAAREKEFPLLFGTFYSSVKEEKGIKEYLASKRRLPYSMGIFRHYEELDRE